MSLFSPAAPRLTLTQISRRLGLPKTTTLNLLARLLTAGYIEKVDGDLYALGTSIIGLTPNVRVNVELRDRAAPLLRRLADLSSESVYLTVRDGLHVLYIHAIETAARLMARTAVGLHAPLYCTAVGKAILAFLPDDDIHRYYRTIPLQAITPYTITDERTHRQLLSETRQRGYSIDNQEHEENTDGLGAPFFDASGKVIGSCSLSGAAPEIMTARLPQLSQQLMQTVQEISRHRGDVPVRSALGRFPANF